MQRMSISEEIKPIIENDGVFVSNNPVSQNVYTVYLCDEIGDQKDYRELFNLLRNATTLDTFIVHIHNVGGSVSTAVDIINSMKNSNANVYTVVGGPIYSAAPIIALQGQKVYLEENCFMMFHDYSGGMYGKGSEQEKSVLAYNKFFKEFFTKMTRKFLTKKEIADILSGKDLYLDREECMKRLRKTKKYGNDNK